MLNCVLEDKEGCEIYQHSPQYYYLYSFCFWHSYCLVASSGDQVTASLLTYPAPSSVVFIICTHWGSTLALTGGFHWRSSARKSSHFSSTLISSLYSLRFYWLVAFIRDQVPASLLTFLAPSTVFIICTHWGVTFVLTGVFQWSSSASNSSHFSSTLFSSHYYLNSFRFHTRTGWWLSAEIKWQQISPLLQHPQLTAKLRWNTSSCTITVAKQYQVCSVRNCVITWEYSKLGCVGGVMITLRNW